MTTQFKHQHGDMIDTAASILDAAHGGGADAAIALTRARLKLSREVSRHCTEEIAFLNARRPAGAPAYAAALVRKYHDDLLRWRHDLIACNSNWPPVRVLADPHVFAAEFGGLTDRLRERVRWEEEEFYPVLFGAKAT